MIRFSVFWIQIYTDEETRIPFYAGSFMELQHHKKHQHQQWEVDFTFQRERH
ncbi:hypothetical protein D3C87_736470 [compost metagenome]